MALFTAAALFLFFIFYGGLVSFPRPSRAAFKHDAWMAGVWTGGEVDRPCCPPSKGWLVVCLGRQRGLEEGMRAGSLPPPPTSFHRVRKSERARGRSRRASIRAPHGRTAYLNSHRWSLGRGRGMPPVNSQPHYRPLVPTLDCLRTPERRLGVRALESQSSLAPIFWFGDAGFLLLG